MAQFEMETMSGAAYAHLGNALVTCLEDAVNGGMKVDEALSLMAGVVSDFAHVTMPEGFKEQLAQIVLMGGPVQRRGLIQ